MELEFEKLISTQIRFVCSIEAECEKRNNNFRTWLNNCTSHDQAERVLLEQVKFIGLVLEEVRRSNKFMQQKLKMSYAKLIGLATPYEEAIHALRAVKSELDTYLRTLREYMVAELKKQVRNTSR